MPDHDPFDRLFPGFRSALIETGEATIRVRYGGAGRPLLLLHGIPETHLMWHGLAPRLAADFTVVVTDLRGYGESSKPASSADHAPYSKRVMAGDQVAVMRRLGFERFSVAGHDRGGRVAYRLALDHSERVQKLAVLDIVPTGDALRHVDRELAFGFWVWFFLAQPGGLPEHMVGRNPRFLLDHMLDSWSTVPNAFPEEIRRAYCRNFSDPETLHAICEEYRAALTLDADLDEADRGKRRIACPVLTLWSRAGA